MFLAQVIRMQRITDDVTSPMFRPHPVIFRIHYIRFGEIAVPLSDTGECLRYLISTLAYGVLRRTTVCHGVLQRITVCHGVLERTRAVVFNLGYAKTS
jgi:hypothetical protein